MRSLTYLHGKFHLLTTCPLDFQRMRPTRDATKIIYRKKTAKHQHQQHRSTVEEHCCRVHPTPPSTSTCWGVGCAAHAARVAAESKRFFRLQRLRITVVSSIRLTMPLTVYDPSKPFFPTLAWRGRDAGQGRYTWMVGLCFVQPSTFTVATNIWGRGSNSCLFGAVELRALLYSI